MNSLSRKESKTIAITGATGFIGRHLLNELTRYNNHHIRVLIHNSEIENTLDLSNRVCIKGDLLDFESLEHFATSGCTVVNLVYLSGMSERENLLAMNNLGKACVKAGIQRFIHCSTAVVSGRVSENLINEDTECNPLTEYEVTKLKIEKLFIEKYSEFFEVVVLRPAEVFGPGGRNLLKLANSLMQDRRVVNYLKSCLFRNRRINLVSVENVVAAINFFVFLKKKISDPETFIVSEDDDQMCRYKDVESMLMRGLGKKDYVFPAIPFPSFILEFFLRVAGRTNCNPLSFYSNKKLVDFGFTKKISLQEGLVLFVEWYKKNIINGRKMQN